MSSKNISSPDDYARTLDGVQFGLLNYAGNKSAWRLLPLLNVAHTH